MNEPPKSFRTADNELTKRLLYKYGDKERERSNRAAQLADIAKGTRRRCITSPKHARFAWSGPPHDVVPSYICLECGACACEPEIKAYGYEMETVPDYIILEIFDKDLERQATTNAKFFGGFGGSFDPAR